MLAQNFLSHEVLEITAAAREALVKTLAMFERGEVSYFELYKPVSIFDPVPRAAPVAFNMRSYATMQECGAVCCIAGWAEYLGGLRRFALMNKRLSNPSLLELFDPSSLDPPIPLAPIQVEQAASALRNYLTLGEPRWREVLAA